MAASMNEFSAVVVHTKNAQKMRCVLEKDGYWDGSRRLKRLEGNLVAIPVMTNILSEVGEGCFIKDGKESPNETWSPECNIPSDQDVLVSGYYHDLPCHLVAIALPPSKKQLVLSPHQTLVQELRKTFRESDIPFPEELEKEIPDVWEKHGDLILLPQSSFNSNVWESCDNLWDTVARVLGGHRVARKGRVKQDGFRSPRVELLLGNDGWVVHKDNGVRYVYDVRHCMFSIGNITEKMRVAGFDCAGETVVDLYAGIGYFTLPYLVHALAAMVHACEWNPHAVAALMRGLAVNNVQDRCVVHSGDNRKVCPRGVADRVNLGLIPSSEEGWPVACAALKPHSGGILHIHGNVTSPPRTKKGDTASCGTKHLKQGDATLSSGEKTRDDVSIMKHSVCTANSCTECKPKAMTLRTGIRRAEVSQPFELTADQRARSKEPSKLLIQLNTDTLRSNKLVQLHSLTNSGTERKGNDFQQQEVRAANPAQDEDGNSSGCSAERNDASEDELLRDVMVNTQTLQEDKVEKLSEFTADGYTEPTANDCWRTWADATARQIREILVHVHGGRWSTVVIHIEHVKSYAPHVDHIVADIRCIPVK